MRKAFFRLALTCLLALPALAVAQPWSYSAILKPLNDSGVNGFANLLLDNNLLTVDVLASGLEPNQLHVQHIHGLVGPSGAPLNSTSPTIAQDADHDGFVELAEGLKTYGPILVPLTSPPGSAPNGFPTAPNGQVSYQETFDLSQQSIYAGMFGKDQLLPLSLREIVLHGMTVGTAGAGTMGEVNGMAGYKATLPVASGEIYSVAAVPEPQTYALMLVGLLLSVYVFKRRRLD